MHASTGREVPLEGPKEVGDIESPAGKSSPAPPALTVESPELYFNREISLLRFQKRVLQEAEDPENPLLERVKFLSIVSSNLD